MGGVSGAVVATVALNALNQIKPSLNYESIDSFQGADNKRFAEVAIDKNSLLAYLEQIFDLIDSVVAEYNYISERSVAQTSLESQPELLEFFQNFIGETSNLREQLPPIFEVRLQELNSILRRNGIRIKSYEETSSDEEKELFDLERSLDSIQKKYVTKKPALTKGDTVLLRGQVISPTVSH